MARQARRFNAVSNEPVSVAAVSDKVYHVALYARLSVEQINRPSNSIESQLEIMKAHIRNHPELGEYYEYVDRGFSGTNFERPDFTRMMDDVRNGKINCILVKDLSRFGRDYLETTNFIEVILPFLGVRFISVNDHFDTDKDYNENKSLEIALKNLVNDMYAKDVSKRLVVTRKQEMERGRFTGSNAPYGYKVDEKDPLRHYVIDEPAAGIVRRIYQMALDGMSVREISVALQKDNVSIPGQYLKTGHLYQEPGDPVKKWHVGTISNILRGQAYIGNLVQGRRRARLCDNEKRHFTDKDEWIITENTHEAIVSRRDFEKVRELAEKKAEASTFHSDRGKGIPMETDKYAGILYCGVCGKRIPQSSNLKENGKKLVRNYFYQCNNNYDARKKKYCGSFRRRDTLDDSVFQSLKLQADWFCEHKELMEILNKKADAELKKLVDVARKIEKQIAKEEFEGSRLYEAYVTGDISREELMAQQEASAVKISRLKDKQTASELEYAAKKKELQMFRKQIGALFRVNGRQDIDREMLELLVKKIELFPHTGIQITWNFDVPVGLEGDERE